MLMSFPINYGIKIDILQNNSSTPFTYQIMQTSISYVIAVTIRTFQFKMTFDKIFTFPAGYLTATENQICASTLRTCQLGFDI